MSDQARIAEILREQYPGPCDCGTCTAVWAHHVAGILNEEFHPVIETLEQIDALPRGVVVRSAAGTIAARFDQTYGVVFGDDRPFPWARLALPARVLYTPEVDGDC